VAGSATPALAVLTKAGVPHEIFRFEVISDLSESGDIAPDQVFKTLIIALPRELAVAIVPVPSRLSLKAAAAALGAAKASMAEPGVAERVTGYVVGGISPFGQRKPLRTVVDSSAPNTSRPSRASVTALRKSAPDFAVALRSRTNSTGSGERALPGDVPADDEGLDLGSSFVGDQGFHVAQVAHDMEVEQDTVAA
jgi:Cys-tRNA(Pro)/Cys-tRNA(Cys) deacylase